MQSIDAYILYSAQVQWDLTRTRFDIWIRTDLFHFRWWGMLLLFIAALFIWWKTVDKSRLNEIMLYYALVIIMILVLDELGEELTLWYYTTDIIPIFPPMSAINLSCLPTLYSLVFQYFRTWKGFFMASATLAVVSCFVLEPLFVWVGVYGTLSWQFYYGLPLYFAIAILGRAAVDRVNSIALKQ